MPRPRSYYKIAPSKQSTNSRPWLRKSWMAIQPLDLAVNTGSDEFPAELMLMSATSTLNFTSGRCNGDAGEWDMTIMIMKLGRAVAAVGLALALASNLAYAA